MPTISLRSTLLLAAASPLLVVLGLTVLFLGRAALGDVRSQTSDSVERASSVFEAQMAAEGRALMMHAKEAAHAPGLADALRRRDTTSLQRLAEGIELEFGEPAILTDAEGESLFGPPASGALLAAVRRGEMPVSVDSGGGSLRLVSLAPVHAADGNLVGAAGVYLPLDEKLAALLAGLTRTDVTFVLSSGLVAGTTRRDPNGLTGGRDIGEGPAELDFAGETYLAAVSSLGDAGYAIFYRSLDAATAPVIRSLRILAGGTAVSLMFVLALAWIASGWAARPAEELAESAAALSAGDFHHPVRKPRIRELERLANAFTEMRDALASQISELEGMNRELAAKERRLREVQAELIQREKLAATGRIIAQLSHEINNPIASVQNCLAVLERRHAIDERNRSFLTMAIDEVDRLARLTRQILDLNRRRPGEIEADPAEVARQTLLLEQQRLTEHAIDARVDADNRLGRVAIAPDALKQVLLNLVQNAEDVMPKGGSLELEIRQLNRTVRLTVSDSGPGVPADIVPRIFDPFFTTKSGTRGVGLGLFVAEEIVRTHGGRIAVERRESRGASFVVELPASGSERRVVSAAEEPHG